MGQPHAALSLLNRMSTAKILYLILLLSASPGYSEEAPTESKPVAKPTEDTSKKENPKPAGTRPVPKVGVREAKVQCKQDGHKGIELSKCISEKVR